MMHFFQYKIFNQEIASSLVPFHVTLFFYVRGKFIFSKKQQSSEGLIDIFSFKIFLDYTVFNVELMPLSIKHLFVPAH